MDGNNKVTIGNITTATRCQQQCQEQADCKFFTFRLELKQCYLMADASNQTDCASCTSGPKQCNDTANA